MPVIPPSGAGPSSLGRGGRPFSAKEPGASSAAPRAGGGGGQRRGGEPAPRRAGGSGGRGEQAEVGSVAFVARASEGEAAHQRHRPASSMLTRTWGCTASRGTSVGQSAMTSRGRIG